MSVKCEHCGHDVPDSFIRYPTVRPNGAPMAFCPKCDCVNAVPKEHPVWWEWQQPRKVKP